MSCCGCCWCWCCFYSLQHYTLICISITDLFVLYNTYIVKQWYSFNLNKKGKYIVSEVTIWGKNEEWSRIVTLSNSPVLFFLHTVFFLCVQSWSLHGILLWTDLLWLLPENKPMKEETKNRNKMDTNKQDNAYYNIWISAWQNRQWWHLSSLWLIWQFSAECFWFFFLSIRQTNIH